MNRSGLLLAGAAAALALACGSNPAKYLVALDQTALASLPGSCYPSGTAPNPPPTVTPALVQHEFTVWDGAQNKHYLEIDSVSVRFPTSTVFFGGLFEGGPKSWTLASTRDLGSSNTETRTMAFSFTELGSTLLGSIAVTDTFECSTTCSFYDCQVTLPLNGRQVEATGFY
ncbi:MAG TPA: hypothetical protein VND93_11045 [Myxococcales bacterium]|nr:hypothetical protein [Myxococcales bacterium]